MKKLIAILLSALLLCSLMSFATVSAEEITEPTIVASTVATAKPGDTILFKGSRGMRMEQILDAFVAEEK